MRTSKCVALRKGDTVRLKGQGGTAIVRSVEKGPGRAGRVLLETSLSGYHTWDIGDLEVVIAPTERMVKASDLHSVTEALKSADDIMATWYSSEYIESKQRKAIVEARNKLTALLKGAGA